MTLISLKEVIRLNKKKRYLPRLKVNQNKRKLKNKRNLKNPSNLWMKVRRKNKQEMNFIRKRNFKKP